MRFLNTRVLILLFTLIAPSLSPQSVPPAPEQLLKEGHRAYGDDNKEEALNLYYQWLSQASQKTSLPGQYHEILLRCLSLETSPQVIRDNLGYYLQFYPEGRQKREALYQLAQWEEVLGYVEDAGRHYEKAATMLKHDIRYSWLIQSGILLLETGRMENLQRLILWIEENTYDPDILISCGILSARVEIISGLGDRALDQMEELRRIYPQVIRRPDYYYALWEISCRVGDTQLAEEARLQLKQDFSTSPEGLLAGDSKNSSMTFLPEPSRFMGGFSSTTAPSETMIKEEGDLVLIQVGAFRDRHNAKDLSNDLKNAGFSGGIYPVPQQELFRVIAYTKNMGGETFVSLLRESGFSGFPLTQQKVPGFPSE